MHALRCAAGRPVLVVAGDMPLVTADVLAALVRAPLGGAPALVPRARRAPAAAVRALRARRRWARLQDFAHDVPVGDAVLALAPAILEWPDEQAFFNVNAPEDLLHAASLLNARR